MRSDADVERMLEDWLESEAQPMPSRAMDSILEATSRRRQLGGGTRFDLDRLPAGILKTAFAAALVMLAILAGPTLIDTLNSLNPSQSGAGEGDPPDMHWDAMAQFREYPNQLNPAPDAYGNREVFTYLHNLGAVHDPARYVPFSEFESDGVQSWYDAGVENHFVGWAPGDDSLTMHPAGGGDDVRAAIVAWRSPVDTAVAVSGRVEVDASCGDGIIFSVDHGTESLETIALPGGSRSFAVRAEMRIGEVLYFIVEPGSDSNCDTTLLNVTIDSR